MNEIKELVELNKEFEDFKKDQNLIKLIAERHTSELNQLRTELINQRERADKILEWATKHDIYIKDTVFVQLKLLHQSVQEAKEGAIKGDWVIEQLNKLIEILKTTKPRDLLPFRIIKEEK